MKKHIKKAFNNKKISAIVLEYILAIECLLLIILLLKENIDLKTVTDQSGIKWSYSINNGYIEDLCYHSGKIGSIIEIPDNINGYPVISIKGKDNGLNIFNDKNNKVVKEIIIPDSIKIIKQNTFKNCSGLKKINIPDSVEKIEAKVFEGCSNLKEITISQLVTSIEKETFNYCVSLEKINLPDNLKYIEDSAFSNCNSLKNINLPESLNTLGESAFSYCTDLEEITIPKNIQRIGYNSFISCTSLSAVNIHNGLTSIGNNAFNDCSNLQRIVIPDSVNSIGIGAFMNCSSLKEIIMPKELIGIEKSTFYNCSNLQTINLKENIEKIEVQAFANCENLKNINIPAKTVNIGAYAFYGCKNLINMQIDKNNKCYTFENGILYTKNKSEIVSCINNKDSIIRFPEYIKTIKEGAYRGNNYIEKIYLDNNIEKIESFAFANCNNLADIYIENKKEDILFSNGWNLNTYAYIHDSDCKHIVEQISQKDNNISTEIKCGDTHTFRVNSNTQNLKVRVISEGAFQNSNKVSEIIYPNEDGIYVIEGIKRNIKILLQSKNDAGGVYIRYVDASGNDIEQSEYIEEKIGEKYNIKPKNIEGFGIIKDDSINKDGIFTDDLITLTFTYQKVNRLEINLLEGQDILLYIIVILSTILINLIIYVIVDRFK